MAKAQRIFIVALQFSTAGGKVWPYAEGLVASEQYESWLDLSVRIGCFGRKCVDTTRRLSGLGLPLKGAMCATLLPPSLCVSDVARLDCIGAAWSSWIFEVLSGRRITGAGAPTARRVVCLGEAATTACLGYEAPLLSMHELRRDAPGMLHGVNPESLQLLSLPLPDVRNKWWNDPNNWREALEAVDAFLRLAPWESE